MIVVLTFALLGEKLVFLFWHRVLVVQHVGLLSRALCTGLLRWNFFLQHELASYCFCPTFTFLIMHPTASTLIPPDILPQPSCTLINLCSRNGSLQVFRFEFASAVIERIYLFKFGTSEHSASKVSCFKIGVLKAVQPHNFDIWSRSNSCNTLYFGTLLLASKHPGSRSVVNTWPLFRSQSLDWFLYGIG